jgi:hypothetical protein
VKGVPKLKLVSSRFMQGIRPDQAWDHHELIADKERSLDNAILADCPLPSTPPLLSPVESPSPPPAPRAVHRLSICDSPQQRSPSPPAAEEPPASPVVYCSELLPGSAGRNCPGTCLPLALCQRIQPQAGRRRCGRLGPLTTAVGPVPTA